MNRIGGTILVGITDKGEIKGIDLHHVFRAAYSRN